MTAESTSFWSGRSASRSGRDAHDHVHQRQVDHRRQVAGDRVGRLQEAGREMGHQFLQRDLHLAGGKLAEDQVHRQPDLGRGGAVGLELRKLLGQHLCRQAAQDHPGRQVDPSARRRADRQWLGRRHPRARRGGQNDPLGGAGRAGRLGRLEAGGAAAHHRHRLGRRRAAGSGRGGIRPVGCGGLTAGKGPLPGGFWYLRRGRLRFCHWRRYFGEGFYLFCRRRKVP